MIFCLYLIIDFLNFIFQCSVYEILRYKIRYLEEEFFHSPSKFASVEVEVPSVTTRR